MAKQHVIATSANGKEVYVYLIQTPAATQISRQPHLATLIKEVVEQLNLTTPQISIEQDMGRAIGYGELLQTTDKDTVFYAKQPKSDLYTRFVKNKKSNATSFLSIVLIEDDSGSYELRDVWIGKAFPPLPGDKKETDQSKAYWENHAVAYNGQPLLASTQTKDCPY